jgi:hypothetical protein
MAEESALSGMLQQSGVNVDQKSIDRLVAFDEDDHDVNATAAMFAVCASMQLRTWPPFEDEKKQHHDVSGVEPSKGC